VDHSLNYFVYFIVGLGAIAVYAAMPREGASTRSTLLVLFLAIAAGSFLFLLHSIAGEAANRWYFYILSLLAVGGAVRVVTHPKPVYSALFFILVVLSTAGLMVLAGAEFLAAALVIVYAGAILVTYVFVIMLAQQSPIQDGGALAMTLDYDRRAREPIAAVVAGFILVGTLSGVIVGRRWPAWDSAVVTPVSGNTLDIGKLLMTDFAVSVELAGVLLMVAMIGAISIAKKSLPRAEEFGDSLPPGEIGKRVKPF
jgi:NADH-quinone oxidoreductase subunit J